ncbi:MAG: VCBS repeat-containing protein, partial [Gemmatimonadota bacterium]|nr:VCBS repeat-containing protein [Gemmatimonadota bacterium]
MPEVPVFRRHTIYEGGPAERMDCVVGDLDGDGVQEFVIATRNPDGLHWFGRTDEGAWVPHLMDDTFPSISVGTALVDLTGNGKLDLVSGTSDRGSHVYWWECPDDPARRWTRRVVFELPQSRIHDLLVADIDGDGRNELYVWNPDAGTIFSVPIPDDPYVTPWPGVSKVASGVNEQDFAAADVDGDGQLELIAGTSWYRLLPNGEW